MIKYFVLFILLFSSSSFASEPLKIELENHNSNLRVYLINVSKKEILVYGRFPLRPSDLTSGVTLEIIDKEGKKCPYYIMINPGPVSEQDIVSLWPGYIIGKEFKPEECIKFYFITGPGVYKVRAIYKNENKHWADKGVYDGRITSGWVNFKITETDMKNALGENWREIIQGAIERERKAVERLKTWKEEHEARSVD